MTRSVEVWWSMRGSSWQPNTVWTPVPAWSTDGTGVAVRGVVLSSYGKYYQQDEKLSKWPIDVTTWDRQTDGPTNLQTDRLQELLEWPLATKNLYHLHSQCAMMFSPQPGPGQERQSPAHQEPGSSHVQSNHQGWPASSNMICFSLVRSPYWYSSKINNEQWDDNV